MGTKQRVSNTMPASNWFDSSSYINLSTSQIVLRASIAVASIFLIVQSVSFIGSSGERGADGEYQHVLVTVITFSVITRSDISLVSSRNVFRICLYLHRHFIIFFIVLVEYIGRRRIHRFSCFTTAT